MRMTIRKNVWDYLDSLPNWLEILAWVVLMIALLVLVFGVVYCLITLTKRILGIKIDKEGVDISLKMQMKLANEHQLTLEKQEKQETKEWKNCLDWKDKLAWGIRWRGKELLKGTVVLLIVVIIGLILFFNFSYSDGKATLKPTIKPTDVIKK
jgi:hypothetical protein